MTIPWKAAGQGIKRPYRRHPWNGEDWLYGNEKPFRFWLQAAGL